MVGKKKLALILSGVLIIAGLVSCSKTNSSNEGGKTKDVSKNSNESQEMYTIGINQLVQHDALDASREGFIEGLEEKGFEEGKNLKIDYQNAQGDISIAKTNKAILYKGDETLVSHHAGYTDDEIYVPLIITTR